MLEKYAQFTQTFRGLPQLLGRVAVTLVQPRIATDEIRLHGSRSLDCHRAEVGFGAADHTRYDVHRQGPMVGGDLPLRQTRQRSSFCLHIDKQTFACFQNDP
jgi:hypothetical protein